MNEPEPSDEQLVHAFQQGHEDAFDALVRRFQDRIFRLALVWLHDPQQAADVAQDVLVRAYRGLRSFRFRAAPFTWLYRTTRNVCREYNRRHSTEPLEHEPEDPGPSADDRLRDWQSARAIRELVARLPDRQQQVVVLRVFEELSVAETAKAMSCREGTVKALLHKAMTKLKLSAQILEASR
ncbi:MAG: RNA polymerase sigma factor [Gammaproteobacteria bacterium]